VWRVADETKTDRRGALQKLAVAGGALGCCALAVPAVRFAVAPALGAAGAGHWIKTVPLDSLAEGEPKRVALVADHHDAWTLEKDVELGAAWVLRKGSDVVVWSTVCPHLGCAVNKSATGPGFSCPCHDSSFAADGARLTGPSPRGLDTLASKVEGGFVHVEFQRFRQGTPEKEPI
jgi:menaquinol-cytochrome c reductase iron-sulfur subunit